MSAISEIQNKKVRELLYNTLMEVVTDDTQQTLVLLSNRLRTMKGSVNKEVLEEARLRVTNVLIGMYNKEDKK
jgi:hypothetical protein